MKTRHDFHTKLFSYLFFIGAIAAFAFWFDRLPGKSDIAYVLAGAISATAWAFMRGRKVRNVPMSYGPFTPIAEAISNSTDEIAAWLNERPYRVVFAVNVFRFIGIVALKHVIEWAFTAIYSPLLVVAIVLLGGVAWLLTDKVPSTRKPGQTAAAEPVDAAV